MTINYLNQDYKPHLSETDRRVVIVGGPRTGKSTFAAQIRHQGSSPVFCGDPLSLVKEPQDDVTYLPEGLSWSESSQYVVDNWFAMRGSWILEGVVMARALRKYVEQGKMGTPIDRILVLTEHHPLAVVTPGQASMHKAVMTVWEQVATHFQSVTDYVHL